VPDPQVALDRGAQVLLRPLHPPQPQRRQAEPPLRRAQARDRQRRRDRQVSVRLEQLVRLREDPDVPEGAAASTTLARVTS
jgi:hypothetical protein